MHQGRLRLRPWLEEQIDSGRYPGVVWLDEVGSVVYGAASNGIFNFPTCPSSTSDALCRDVSIPKYICVFFPLHRTVVCQSFPDSLETRSPARLEYREGRHSVSKLGDSHRYGDYSA